MNNEILNAVSLVNSHISDYVLTFLLAGAGIFFTVRTRFVQIRCFNEGLKKAFGSFSLSGKQGKKGLSSYQALTAAFGSAVSFILAGFLSEHRFGVTGGHAEKGDKPHPENRPRASGKDST